jgi:methylthioribose-1-phosphate isomerase
VALEVARDPSSLDRACTLLGGARPTAVNLARAVDRMRAAGGALAEAQTIEREEQQASEAIATHGADYLGQAATVLTHCNTGALAAPGRGTALAVVAELAERGVLARAFATETRPLLQGARLTAYELERMGVAYSVIVDGAAPALIASGQIDAVIVGCDRVAANGDVANKVGTYSLALAASAASIPFVVAGPTSTIDLDCPSGDRIVIEQRDPDEVRTAAGQLLTPGEAPCHNPAFDLTPATLVSAIVTERGVISPVSAAALATRCA